MDFLIDLALMDGCGRKSLVREKGGESRGSLMVLVGLSLAISLLVFALRVGIDATPSETTDSAGRAMGFNDKFSHEHYRIIIGNMSLIGIGVYEGILVAVQLVMGGLLVFCRDERRIASFALWQYVCFPWGVLGFLAWPSFVWGVFTESNDREVFVEMPFAQMLAGAVWWSVSSFIAWRMWKLSKQQASEVPND